MSLKFDYEYYKSLSELPIINWINIHKEKTLIYIIKIDNYNDIKINEELQKELEEKWIILYDEFIDDFGLNKKYQRILELERRIATLKCNVWIDDNKFLRNEIRINERKLLKEKGTNTIDEKGTDFTKQLVYIEKWLGSTLDIETLKTRKYFTYIQMMEKEVENIEKMKLKKEHG